MPPSTRMTLSSKPGPKSKMIRIVCVKSASMLTSLNKKTNPIPRTRKKVKRPNKPSRSTKIRKTKSVLLKLCIRKL